MTPNFSLETLLADPPKLHEVDGQLHSDWRIDDETCLELKARLKPGMKTLETGAGLSTIIFAGSGCQHTCILPDEKLAYRVQDYCRSLSIDTSNVRFIISGSSDVIHQMGRSAYDLILIDGCHGFPTVFVDFYYAAKALKTGGALIIDDLRIYTCDLVASFMQSDPGWNVELMTIRFAIGVKIAETVDQEWTNQPFVVLRSKGASVIKHPLYFAKVTARTLRNEGARETARRISGWLKYYAESIARTLLKRRRA
jgi:Methyltransferase domain